MRIIDDIFTAFMEAAPQSWRHVRTFAENELTAQASKLAHGNLPETGRAKGAQILFIYTGSQIMDYAQNPFPQIEPYNRVAPLAKSINVGELFYRIAHKLEQDKAGKSFVPIDMGASLGELKKLVPEIKVAILMDVIDNHGPLPPDVRSNFIRLAAEKFEDPQLLPPQDAHRATAS
jgi:hypothetical protein